jgi:hypothetical protein
MPGKSQTDFTSFTVVIVLIVEEEERDNNPGDARSTRLGSQEADPSATKSGSLCSPLMLSSLDQPAQNEIECTGKVEDIIKQQKRKKERKKERANTIEWLSASVTRSWFHNTLLLRGCVLHGKNNNTRVLQQTTKKNKLNTRLVVLRGAHSENPKGTILCLLAIRVKNVARNKCMMDFVVPCCTVKCYAGLVDFGYCVATGGET